MPPLLLSFCAFASSRCWFEVAYHIPVRVWCGESLPNDVQSGPWDTVSLLTPRLCGRAASRTSGFVNCANR